MARVPAGRPAKEIIDAALADNAWWEQLCFGLIVVAVVAGLSILATGIVLSRDLLAATGGGVTGLFWPALSYARSLRRDNIRVRLYEIALAMAQTSEEAAKLIEAAIGALDRPPPSGV